MISVPTNKADLLDLTTQLVEQCRVSVGMRSLFYQTLNQITETGRYDGGKALINKMFKILDRTKSHLFSNIELKFAIDFDRPQPRISYDRANEAAKVLSRTWERNGTGTTFQQGVFESLKYGACFLKQWPAMQGPEQNKPRYYDKLVMPWQFGVYREDETHLDRQEVLCETITLTGPEVWQRICHQEDSKKLFNKIMTHAQAGQSTDNPQSFFHNILSTSQLDTSASATSRPGGIMQLNNAPNYATMGPTIAPETVQMHELWVQDSEDYTTIQMIEPDIIIAPYHKKSNLLISNSQLQPYRLIQPNAVTNWIWGRSELMDLTEPQGLLAQWCDDLRRLMGVQFDKLLGFIGETGLTDELYGQARMAGYINMGQGSSINDLTPKIPPEALPMLQFLIRTIDELAGYPPIMQGQGDSGIRANDQAQTMMKTASPTLRDRSLLVEYQCAAAADLTFELMQAKDESNYWLKADDPIKDVDETKFLLTDLPDDMRVTVDSHSSSPIFTEENTQMIYAAAKLGYVTGDYVLDNMPFPNKEMAKLQLKEKEKAQADFMQNLMQTRPDLTETVLKAQLKGGKR